MLSHLSSLQARRNAPTALLLIAMGAWSGNAAAQAAPTLLDSVARVAIERNLSLARTREREHEANLAVRQANGAFIPSLALDSRYSKFDGVVNIGDFINPTYAALNQLLGKPAFPTNISVTLPMTQETHLRAQMPVFNGGVFAAVAGARALRSLRGAERAVAVRKLDADARIAWLSWARASQAVEIWNAALPVLDENVRVAQRLVDAGSGTPDAVLRARAAAADARQQLAEAVRLRDAARGAFNLILDQDDATLPPAIPASLPDVPDLTLEAAVASSQRREERRVVAAAIDGARAQGQAATSAFLPGVAVAADYGIQGDRYRFDTNHDVASASVVLQWNVFNGGQDQARREIATAARRGAELQAAEVDRQIVLDVRTAWDAVRAAREAVVAANARLAAAQSAFTLVDRRYAEGLAPHLEWSDARSQLTAAQLNASLTQFLLAARGIDLERAAALRSLPNN